MNPETVETTIVAFGEKPKHVERWPWPSGLRVLARPMRLAPADVHPFRDPGRLARLIDELQPDIVHLHEPQFVLAVQAAIRRSARKGQPSRLVVHLHNDYRRRDGSMPEVLLPHLKQALKRCALIACSATIEDAAVGWLGIGRDEITRIEDGADDIAVGRADKALAEALCEAAGGAQVVACMANLAPHKRIEDFIEACERLSSEGLPIFGLLMGYGKKESATLVRDFFDSRIDPPHGEFLYRVGQPHSLFETIDIGVSPSSLEGLGLNILEYQSHGIPVVCTDLQPHREMVEDGVTGILYPVGDVDRLTEALRRLINDEGARRMLGEAGRESSSRRRWKDTAEATARFYERVISAPP
jgi:glycosyltransferase involved in cell wall biosynthesis